MKRFLMILVLGLLLSGCELNKDKDTKAIEKCADRATAGHLYDRQRDWQKMLDMAILLGRYTPVNLQEYYELLCVGRICCSCGGFFRHIFTLFNIILQSLPIFRASDFRF